MNFPTRLTLIALAGMLALPLGCAEPQYVRDTEMENIDEYTMSLRFDRKDLDRLYKENIDKLLSSRITDVWERRAAAGDPAVVAIFPMRNETSEHIGNSLDALLSKFETDLVNNSAADVVSHENQPELIAEIKRQQSAAYDPQRLASFGKQLGAQYFVTGKVYDVAEKVEDERRVQYFMFVQVIDVETGAIKFQNESALTKGLME
jgi:PBP1b-binding outer membrane lipoprotein LpoB